MKVGIYGGTFNPPHSGHIQSISHLIQNGYLDQIWVMPALIPPHKNIALSIEHRLKMLEMAFAELNNIKISDIELKSLQKSYTVNTLEMLKVKYKEIDFFFILGADNLKTFHTWKDYKKLLKDNEFIMMRRPDFQIEAGDYSDLSMDEFLKLTKNSVDTPLIPVSSSQIREMFYKEPDMVKNYLTKDIFDYIKANNLYMSI